MFEVWDSPEHFDAHREQLFATLQAAGLDAGIVDDTPAALAPPGLAARHLVDADGRGEDQRVVLSRGDLDPVCVANPEPAL